MDYAIWIILILVVAGLGGFFVAARAVLSNWRVGSRGHEEADARQGIKTGIYERCFNECMSGENWEPDKTGNCETVCRSRAEAALSVGEA
ncbi:MAG: hypothetical protein HY913_03225 [Desulfomonile tiedjei]|nr:hypothetical protein [Desulfomonile tiedjei]